MRRVLVVLLGTVFVFGCTSAGPTVFTSDHESAALSALDAKALPRPVRLERSTTGLVVADYELTDAQLRALAPLEQFGERALLTIREALLPFGFADFRVNVNGIPPGTGLVRRYGSSRYIDGGTLEWITP